MADQKLNGSEKFVPFIDDIYSSNLEITCQGNWRLIMESLPL